MATINFGDIELNKENFLTSAANDVNEYVQLLAWSSKRKNMFMDAYNDLMAQNITGAKVIDGSWHILYDNDLIDLSKMSNKLKLMYKEAAWYIKSKMEENLPSKNEVKEEIRAFNNSNEFRNYIKRQFYGDLDFTMNQWNNRDFIGDNGLRGTEKRKKALVEALEEYSKYLDTKDFDYSSTPYGTKENLQAAISNAINALNNNGDYNDALNRLGLNPQDWLSDGSNDIVATDENGRDITRAEYNQLQQAKQQDSNSDSKTDIEQKKVDDGFRIRKSNTKFENNPIFGVSLETLTLRFGGNEEKLYTKLTEYYNRGVNNLSRDETDELYGIYSNLAKSSISDDEYKMLLRFATLKDRLKGNFRKLLGVDGLYLDRKSGRVIQLYNENQTRINPNYGKSLLPKTQTEEEKQDKEKLEYLNSTGSNGGFSAAEWEELAAIGLDIASIINPEPFSAAAMSLGAAGSRNLAKALLPGKWNVGDYIGLGLDYLTSVVGAVPIIGDAVLAGKVVKLLRKLARFGAWMDIIKAGGDDAKEAWSHITGEGKMTAKDWRTIGTLIRGVVSHGRLSRSNITARKAMQESGVNVTPANTSKTTEWFRRVGFYATPLSHNIPTLKLTNSGGEEVDLPISNETKLLLQKVFKGRKPSERTEVARANSGVKLAAKLAGVDLNNLEVAHSNSLRNLNRVTRATIGKTNDSFGNTTAIATPRTNEEFENFLSNRGFGNKLWYGSNSALRRQRSILGLDKTPTTLTTLTSELVIENPVSPLRPSNPEEGRLLDIRHGVVTNDRLVVSRPYKAGPKKQAKVADKKLIRKVLKKGEYTDEFANEGVITFKGPDGNTHRLEVSFSKDGNNYNVTRTSSDGSQSAALVRMEELKSYVARLLQEILNGKRNDVQLARLIRELRKSKFGWLKQGGKFNLDKEISNFLKEISV